MEKKSGTEMSREKQIIEEMRKEVASIHRFFLEDDDYESLDEYIADMLYNAGYRKQEWISVDERLPEEAGRAYLVWDNVQATVKKRFFNRIPVNMHVETYPRIREYFGNVSDHERYTHWMPLPEAPKMKGGERE